MFISLTGKWGDIVKFNSCGFPPEEKDALSLGKTMAVSIAKPLLFFQKTREK